MDRTDERILDLLKGNARMSFQELGDAIGMSRVAAKKRVLKLEQEGIIRAYNTCIYRDDEITMFIDIALKICKVIDWPWLWVLSPILLTLVFLIVVAVLVVIVTAVNNKKN